MKVCFFSPSSYPYFYKNTGVTSGGAELQMSLIAKELAKNKKYEVCFFIADYGQAKVDYVDGVKLIRAFKLPKHESVFSKLVKAFKYFFLLAKHRPDVVINTTASSIVGLSALYKRILGYKFIYRTAHTQEVDRSFIENNGIIGKIYRYGLLKADVVLSQNAEHCKCLKNNHNIDAIEFKNIFYDKKHTNINKNGVLWVARFEKWKQAQDDKKHTNINKNGVLWVARFEKWKQAQVYLQLAKRIKNERFTIICPTTKNNMQKWLIFKNNCLKEGNIDFKDKVDFTEINNYFNNAAVFVNTSLSEGFPNTFLQAAAAHTPIVSLNVNPDNFLTDYNCGICCNNNFEMLVETVNELINNREKAKLMGDNANKYLLQNHDANVIIPKLENIIIN